MPATINAVGGNDCMRDRDGIIRFWNHGAERIFGYVWDDAHF